MKDSELLKKMTTDPDRAMIDLIDQYTGLIYSIIYSRISSVGSTEDVKEGISDVFLEFYQQKEQIDLSKGSVKGYLAVLAKHKGIDLFRRLSGVISRNVCLDEISEHLVERQSTPEQVTIRKEQRAGLLQAIRTLGEPDEEIFIRKYYLGQKTKEIAALLKLRDNTVDKKISRGLKKLRILLEGDENGVKEQISTK